MPISQAISINYFKILLYDDTLALLVMSHCFLSLFHNLEIHISNMYTVMYDTMSSFRVTLFDTEFMSL